MLAGLNCQLCQGEHHAGEDVNNDLFGDLALV